MIGAQQCHTQVPPTCAQQCAHLCPAMHPPVPSSATHLCPPTCAQYSASSKCHQSVPSGCASQCRQSVPSSDVSATYQCCLSVPIISVTYQCH
ncbi:unnamed protein product [Staurois parvus]|uniref:Uncharacterized protein n=1 Tax=Staurois parvus TaxID=386267 RepID=A0ABN9D2T6_9NEOB|nr:unnamed protein product [Staurois parvus]